MSKMLLSLVFGGAVALTAVGAQAFPSAPSVSAQAPSDVIQVAGGCGLGFHRGPRGGCRPNRGPVVVAPAPRAVVVVPAAHCRWVVTPRGRARVCR